MSRNPFVQVRVVEDQDETIKEEPRQLSDEETKAFLYKNYPDLYKKMYPNETIEVEDKNKPIENKIDNSNKFDQNKFVPKKNKVHKIVKYNTQNFGEDQVNFRIEINTDMDDLKDF